MSQNSNLMNPRRMGVAALLLLGAMAAPAVLAAVPPANSAPENPQIKMLKAAAGQAIRQGNFPLAIIQMNNALRLDPNNAAIRSQLGIVLLEGGDAAGAERELRQAQANGAKDDNT